MIIHIKIQKLKIFFLCFLFVLLYNELQAQSFTNIEAEKKENSEVYHLEKFDLIIFDSNKVLLQKIDKKEPTTQQFNIITQQSQSKLLYNNKLQEGFLFMEPCKELKEGCKIYSITSKKVSFLCELPFAAYTSENGERMNYNSILPYISIIRSSQRTLLFFNTPIVVIYPNSPQEQILESKNFYHILQKDSFLMQEYNSH